MPSVELQQTFAEDLHADDLPINADRYRSRHGHDDKSSEQPTKKSTSTKSLSDRAMSLHVSKLRGISFDVRAKLKRNGVTYTHQLLAAAGSVHARHQFSEKTGIEEPVLERLTCRADLARVKGIGAIFADMLEILGVDRLTKLADQDPSGLHDRLYSLNSAERFARRAPTPEEVNDWVAQASDLPKLVVQHAQQ